MKSSRRTLALTSSVLVLAVAWLALRDHDSGPSFVDVDARSGGSATTAPVALVADPVELVSPPAAIAEGARAISVVASPALDAAGYPSDTLWVEGRVELPLGTPSDEIPTVVARGRSFLGSDEHSVAVGADGRFRAPFASTTRTGSLRLEGRCLRGGSTSITASAPPADLVLTAQLAGCLRLRLMPTALAAARGVDFEAASLWAIREGASGPATQRAATPDAEGFVELRGIDAGVLTVSAILQMRGFALERFEPLDVEPGRVRDVTVRLLAAPHFSGFVRDEKGAPVANAKLRLATEVGEREHDSTGADGRFDFWADAIGPMALTVTHTDFEPVAVGSWIPDEGFELADIAVALDAGLVIRGVVRGTDGAPAVGVRVTIYREGDESSDGDQVTADDGSFRFGALEPGDHVLAATAPKAPGLRAGLFGPATARRGSVPAGSSGVVLELRGGSTVRGRVVDDRGVGVDAFEIVVKPDIANRVARGSGRRAYEDARGAFGIEDVPEGAWDVRAWTRTGYAEPIRIELPRDAGRELAFTIPRPATLSGRVLDPDGAVVPDALVVESAAPDTPVREQARTDQAGRYRIEVTGGTVHLRASRRDERSSSPYSMLVVAAGEQRDGVDLVLRRPGRIFGVVRDSEDHARAGVKVHWRGAAQHAGNFESTLTDAHGEYAFAAVDPGEVVVSLSGERYEDQLQRVVDLAEGGATRVDFGGRPVDAVRVRGKLTSSGPVAGAILEFCRTDSDERPENLPRATIAVDGTYDLLVGGAGDYRIVIRRRNEQLYIVIQRRIAAPETFLDIDLGTARVRGRLVDEKGRALNGVRVDIRPDKTARAEDDIAVGSTWTGVDGTFEIGPLVPATYTLFAERRGKPDADGKSEERAELTGIVVSADARIDGLELRLTRAP